jgi:hypothetical protein
LLARVELDLRIAEGSGIGKGIRPRNAVYDSGLTRVR